MYSPVVADVQLALSDSHAAVPSAVTAAALAVAGAAVAAAPVALPVQSSN